MNSAIRNAESLEQKKARAMLWIDGMRELSERAHRQTSRALDLCERAVDWEVDGETAELVIEACKELEQYVGREHVATSPLRSNGSMAKVSQAVSERQAKVTRGDDLPRQVFLFEEEAE